MPEPVPISPPAGTERDAGDLFHMEMVRACLERVMDTRERLLRDLTRLREAGEDSGCVEAVALADLLSGDASYDLSEFEGNGWSVGGAGGGS